MVKNKFCIIFCGVLFGSNFTGVAMQQPVFVNNNSLKNMVVIGGVCTSVAFAYALYRDNKNMKQTLSKLARATARMKHATAANILRLVEIEQTLAASVSGNQTLLKNQETLLKKIKSIEDTTDDLRDIVAVYQEVSGSRIISPTFGLSRTSTPVHVDHTASNQIEVKTNS